MIPYRIFFSLCLILFFQHVTISVRSETDRAVRDTFTLGQHYFQMEQYDKALSAFDAVRKQAPSSVIYCYIGMVMQEQNRLSDAVEAYKNALTFKASSQIYCSAHLHLGIVFKAQGKLELAETHLREALTLNPDTPEAHIHLGELFLLQRKFEMAVNEYRKSINLNPNFIESYYGLGRLAEMQRDYISAIDYYRKAISQNSYDPMLHYRIALVYRKLEKYEDSSAAMTQFERMKSYSDNVHRFRETIYKNPRLPILYVKLGELHERHGNIVDAQRVYEISTKIHPTFTPAYHRLGMMYINGRDLPKAKSIYQQVTEIDSDNVEAWLKLGVIEINLKQFESAIAAFKQAITVDETSAEAHNNLARLYAGLGTNTTLAIKYAKKAVELSPNSKHYDTLAYTYYHNAQFGDALDAINRALSISPDVPAYVTLRTKIEFAIEEKKNGTKE